MRISKIKLDSTEKLSVTFNLQISVAAGGSWLLLQSNHDVSTFVLQADLRNEISKEKKEYKWKNPAELERKRPHFLKSVSNERGIQGFQKILEEWAAPFDLAST